MQSFDTTIRLAEIRRDELLQAAAQGRTARRTHRARFTRRRRTALTNRSEGASR